MNDTYAFFDVDGTLLRLKSMFSFHDFWYRRWTGIETDVRAEEYEDVSAILRALVDADAPRELINRRYYEFFSGRSVDEVTRCAHAWARGVIADSSLFVAEVIEELRAFQGRGVEPVFVSGSFVQALEPIAEHLDVSHVLATRLVHDGGKFTGRFHAPQTIGSGKAEAIKRFLERQSCAPTACWAFGDDVSDLPMLEAVGHPVAVVGDAALGEAARNRGWKCMNIAPSEYLAAVREHVGALEREAT